MFSEFSDELPYSSLFAVQIILFVIIYIGISIWLTICNYKVNKKFSIMAWIPFLRMCILGKLLVNKPIGIYFIILFFILFMTMGFLGHRVKTTTYETWYGYRETTEIVPANVMINVVAIFILLLEIILLIALSIKIRKTNKKSIK